MNFIPALDQSTLESLHSLARNSPHARVRQRAHAVLLSAKGYPINTIADIFDVDRDTVSRWLKRWREGESLEDEPRSGRPRTLSPEEEIEALKMVLEEPRQIKVGLDKIHNKFSVTLSLDWLRGFLRERGYRYKRMRLSLKHKRDQTAFEAAEAEIKVLQEQAAAAQIDLYYFDEAGFSLRSMVPYAWQRERIEIEQNGRGRLNVLGFLSSDATLTPYVVESSVNSETVIACFDHFARSLQRPSVVLIDNAPVHTSAAFKSAMLRWEEKGLQLKFLPTYSPELNMIEHLWKQIKYYWMPLRAYRSFDALKEALDEVLIGFGSKYHITFS